MKSKYPECYGTPVCALETLYSKPHQGYLFNYIHTNHSIKKHKTYNTIQTMQVIQNTCTYIMLYQFPISHRQRQHVNNVIGRHWCFPLHVLNWENPCFCFHCATITYPYKHFLKCIYCPVSRRIKRGHNCKGL